MNLIVYITSKNEQKTSDNFRQKGERKEKKEKRKEDKETENPTKTSHRPWADQQHILQNRKRQTMECSHAETAGEHLARRSTLPGGSQL